MVNFKIHQKHFKKFAEIELKQFYKVWGGYLILSESGHKTNDNVVSNLQMLQMN